MAPTSDYGVKPMQVAAPLPGSNGSIQQNNSAMTNQSNQTQIKARFGGAKGGKAKGGKAKSRGAKGGAVTVPPIQISYKDTGVNNTSTQANVIASTRTQADLSAAKVYDAQVGQKAGRKSYRKAYRRKSYRKAYRRKSCCRKACCRRKTCRKSSR